MYHLRVDEDTCVLEIERDQKAGLVVICYP